MIDADGKPRVGADVQLQVYRNYGGHSVGGVGPGLILTTDAEGRFRTGPLPVGRASLAIRVSERHHRPVPPRIILPGPGPNEDVGTIRLEADVPYTATVRDEAGQPVVGVVVGGTVGVSARTGPDGKFTIRGQGANLSLWLTFRKSGYQELRGRLTVDARGSRYDAVGPEVRPSTSLSLPVGPERTEDMVLILKRAGTIEGEVLDSATGKPVRPSRVVLKEVERQPDGEVVMRYPEQRPDRLEVGRF